MVADKKRQLPIEYDLLRGAEASSPEFIQYADRNFDEILRSRFVELLPYKQKNFKLTQASLYHQLAAKQIERKVGALELQANRKEFLKSYFSHPEHQDLKRRYEEIVACEKSDLR
jgi:hypothetical protein